MSTTVVACLLRNTEASAGDYNEVLIIQAENDSFYYPQTFIKPDENPIDTATRALFEASGLTSISWEKIGEDLAYICLISKTDIVLPDKWRVTIDNKMTELVWAPIQQTDNLMEEQFFVKNLLLQWQRSDKTP